MVEVINTQRGDLDQIFELFEHSIHYQEKKGYPVWRNYDKSAIIKDLADRNQYKVVIDSMTAIVFSVCYTDKVIWRDLDQGNSIYLHRIVVNREFKGQKLFGTILDWAIKQSKQKGFDRIRMDTWAANGLPIRHLLPITKILDLLLSKTTRPPTAKNYRFTTGIWHWPFWNINSKK